MRELDSERLVVVSSELVIPEAELDFRFSTSGGPGGQHANRSATRVTLRFDVARSRSLSEAQRARLISRLSGRIDASGVLHLSCQDTRSQTRNRELAIDRLRRLLAGALAQAPPRRHTQPTPGSAVRRLDRKRRRGALKRERQRRSFDVDDR